MELLIRLYIRQSRVLVKLTAVELHTLAIEKTGSRIIVEHFMPRSIGLRRRPRLVSWDAKLEKIQEQLELSLKQPARTVELFVQVMAQAQAQEPQVLTVLEEGLHWLSLDQVLCQKSATQFLSQCRLSVSRRTSEYFLSDLTVQQNCAAGQQIVRTTVLRQVNYAAG